MSSSTVSAQLLARRMRQMAYANACCALGITSSVYFNRGGGESQSEGESEHVVEEKTAWCACRLKAASRGVDAVRAMSKEDAAWLNAELASDHAGETGAVYIYRGARSALALRARSSHDAGDDAAAAFCKEHEKTEAHHLKAIERLADGDARTSLIPLWKVAGYMLGFAPTAVFGANGLYATVNHVERFVVDHYESQIARLQDYSLQRSNDDVRALVDVLRECQADEAHHRDDAASRVIVADSSSRSLVDAWGVVVHQGSRAAAEVARHV